MNPPIPKSVCEEEMQNANLDTNEVIIEYITDAQGNKIKRLKPLLINSEPDREYAQQIPSDDNLPAVPKENFIQKREVTVDPYSETISSNDESSDDRTMSADHNSPAISSLLCNPKFISKNNQYFSLSSIYFLYPLTSLPKMVKQEMPTSIKQS